MANDETLWLLLLGGAVIMANESGERPVWGSGWHWPVPDLISSGGSRFPAVITQEFKGPKHAGVDMMLSRRSDNGQVVISGFDPGKKAADGITTDATKSGRFFAPRGTPILAARDAVVWSVTPTVNGIMVVLDHGKPWATFYGHLETTVLERTQNAKSGQRVRAGDEIGTMGAGLNTDPRKGLVDGEHLRHLHFEAWYKGARNAAVDPAQAMATWERSAWRTQF